MFEFNKEAIKTAFVDEFGDRITHLAAAGSIVNGRSNHSSDLDLLLIIKNRDKDDLVKCRTVVQGLTPYKIDLSLKYLEELPKNAADYQDGPRTSLCLAYISSALFIIGENHFTEVLKTLPIYEFRKSIIHAVGEYLMRMESLFFTSDKDDQAEVQKQSYKYLTRIIIDVQLFFKPSDMGPYKLLTRDEMLGLGKQDNRISQYLASITEQSAAEDIIAAMAQLHKYLVDNNTNDQTTPSYVS